MANLPSVVILAGLTGPPRSSARRTVANDVGGDVNVADIDAWLSRWRVRPMRTGRGGGIYSHGASLMRILALAGMRPLV